MMVALAALGLGTGCRSVPRPGTFAARAGDEIVVAGKFVHTGTPVVLWLDPGGYDAYRVERRFSPIDESSWETSKFKVKDLSSPNRYNTRTAGLSRAQVELVRGGGWDLATLQKVVDQFVIHFDVSGTSRACFRTLHDARGLSVHFMLDVDGTIYQTLDVKERAWHATSSNSRSVGIEVANIGTFPPGGSARSREWYRQEADGRTRLVVPETGGGSGLRTTNYLGRPDRPEPVVGIVQGQKLAQYDFTPEQYRALARLTAALCSALPKIRCDYPKDAQGNLIAQKLPDAELAAYQGVLGHYHIQTNKVDPGPAFQWERVMAEARRWMGRRPASTSVKGATLLLGGER